MPLREIIFNNTKKQFPKARPQTAYGKVTTPAEETIQNRPNHILVNMNGTYAFAYVSGSVSSYETGSVVDEKRLLASKSVLKQKGF